MYIIAGLGNPGKEYENTRHNIGFDVIDRLAEEENIAVMESKHKALIGKGYVAGQKVILAKPQTFMNLSGESIREIVDYYKVDDVQIMTGDYLIAATEESFHRLPESMRSHCTETGKTAIGLSVWKHSGRR